MTPELQSKMQVTPEDVIKSLGQSQWSIMTLTKQVEVLTAETERLTAEVERLTSLVPKAEAPSPNGASASVEANQGAVSEIEAARKAKEQK